ncbi:hypothetical protein CYY_001062 [Polysphondylium violaceum]|uniref:Uncharacterized protein n=1 Tax=Polysphondylium violaceum TaxID=133409 RepID=A0A8J4Q2F6_9MYCE|nr:hypothetical protein CYY_001062 [Polysphondylium violaceum]
MIFSALSSLSPCSFAKSGSVSAAKSSGSSGANNNATYVASNAVLLVNTNGRDPLLDLDAHTRGLIDSDIHATIH